MRFLRQSLIGLFLVSLTVAILLFAGWTVTQAVQERAANKGRYGAKRERVISVDLVRAEVRPVVPVITAFGELQSYRTLEIRAARAGTVVDLADNFVEGGQVRAGQVLVRIDPADAQAVLDRAKNDLKDAELKMRN